MAIVVNRKKHCLLNIKLETEELETESFANLNITKEELFNLLYLADNISKENGVITIAYKFDDNIDKYMKSMAFKHQRANPTKFDDGSKKNHKIKTLVKNIVLQDDNDYLNSLIAYVNCLEELGILSHSTRG